MIIIGPFTLLLLVLLLFKPIRKLVGFLLFLVFIGLVYMCSGAPANAAGKSRPQSDGGSMIYAIFECIQATGSCSMMNVPHVDNPADGYTTTFSSLDACQHYASRLTGRLGSSIPEDGRFMISAGLWYQCLGKRVDNWTATR